MEAEYYELLCECLKKLQATGKHRNLEKESKRLSPKLKCNRIINNTAQNQADSRLQKHNCPRWIRSNVETDDDSGVRT